MTDPISMITIGATIASGVVSAAGAVMQGNATNSATKYQAQVAQNNALIAQQNASYERQKGNVEAQTQDMRTKAMLGEQLAGQGASGFDIESGSLTDVRKSTAMIGALDRQTTKNNAERRAYGDDVQATNFTADSQLKRLEGKNAQTAGTINGISSLLSSASSVGTKWSNYKALGVKGF